jgi:Na+/melibiose symporter-like transporter
VPEPLAAVKRERSGFAEYFKLLKRPSVARLLLVDFLVGTGPAITGALFFFYFGRAKGFEKSAASQLLLIYFVGGLVGAPIWTWLSYRLQKHRTLAISSLFYAAVTLASLMIPHGNFPVAALMMFMAGISYAAGAFLLRAMMADVGDEVRLDTRAERTALLYALLSGTVKVGSALAVFLTFTVLGQLGFDPKAKAGEAGIPGLMAMFAIVPAGLAIVASAIVAGFPLHARRHAEIREALNARDLSEAGPEMGQEPRFVEEIHPVSPAAE